jgi:hypothetical protein
MKQTEDNFSRAERVSGNKVFESFECAFTRSINKKFQENKKTDRTSPTMNLITSVIKG